MLFMSSLHFTSWIKTQPAQKLLVRVKYKGNLYIYRPKLVYGNSCLFKRSLRLGEVEGKAGAHVFYRVLTRSSKRLANFQQMYSKYT